MNKFLFSLISIILILVVVVQGAPNTSDLSSMDKSSNNDSEPANKFLNSTEGAIDAIVNSARSGKQLELRDEDGKFSQVAADETIKQKLESGGEAEARGFIREKLCALGLCDNFGHDQHHGHRHGIQAGDVTLVQPVAIKPVGGPIAAVPLVPSKHIPHHHGSVPLFIGDKKPGFGFNPLTKPGGPQIFPGSHEASLGHPVGPQIYPGASGPFVTPIVKPIYPGKVDTHVHHHIHHNQAPVPGFAEDGYYGAAQKPAISIASPSEKDIGGIGSRPKNCFCIPYDQCKSIIQSSGTKTNLVVQGTGVPNSGLVGYGIDPRNSIGRNESNFTAAEDDNENVETTTILARQKREEKDEPASGESQSENRQLTYDGDSCPKGQVSCCQLQQPFQSGSTSKGNYIDSPLPPALAFPIETSEYSQCGKHQTNGGINGRVVTSGSHQTGEGETDFAEYPWQVAILKKHEYICGGSLIDAHHVLTAAHCIKQLTAPDLRIRLGEWDVNSENEFYPYIEREVVSIVIHPKYYAGNLVNDLAVLRFEDSIDFLLSPHINPVCLPPKNLDFTGNRCFVTGWGKDAFGTLGKFQNILKEVDLPVLNHFDCEQKLKKTKLGPDFVLQQGFLCAGGEEGKDACKGDGGGPFVCDVNGSWHLAGIVSWGVECGQRDVPGVYVKVSHYNSWIQQVTGLLH